jgi:hypothetical protein
LNFEQFERRRFVKRFEKNPSSKRKKNTHKKKKAPTKRKHLKQQWQHPLSNTVNTPPLGRLSLHDIEERNRRTWAEEKYCK